MKVWEPEADPEIGQVDPVKVIQWHERLGRNGVRAVRADECKGSR